ncbi:aldo/keto reductase [Aestuariimicrobium ganziense]|uniref:aldo/keto reductase n=1 Tax=Aestuariimicrobium ganziense TaxID=2773677 RepID=UPI001942397E|nr:aldo/keto reductase [Aestuariimicrobium ganziense]
MEQIRLGGSGLKVSRLALGCMSFGDGKRAGQEWVLDEESSLEYYRQALDLGITFWDTANVYSAGSSEEFTGRAVRKLTTRENVVLATKLFHPMHDGPGGRGSSRKAIMEQTDASLRRLDTDHIDLMQVHRFDPETPIEETMEALHDVVKAGKVRYIGASSMWTWQFVTMQYTADLNGWTRFVSMQPQYNLIYREEEREMLPYCASEGIGVVPWSPMARGKLTRPWDEQTTRQSTDGRIASLYSDSDKAVVDLVQQMAADRGVSMATLALAWVLANPAITAPIVGATKPHHLADAAAALDVELTDEEMTALADVYTPHHVQF